MDGCKDGWKLACVGLAAWIGCIASSPGRGGAADGRTVTPFNQVLTPAGRQVELPGLRPQAIALSPDGRLLVTSGKTHGV
jgi:hypothetical protein